VLYKLFEGSWEDGAVVRDRERGIFTHPEKVHEIGHKGKYFEVPGYHLCEPSPQRTPVLYQAGASGAGKAFAASTPSACSWPRRSRCCGTTWPTCAARPPRPGAIRARC
jgi:hypothetical protein